MNSIDLFVTSSAHPVSPFLVNGSQPHLDRSSIHHHHNKKANNYASSNSKSKSVKQKKPSVRKEPPQIVPDENSIEDSGEPATMSCFVMDGQLYDF